MKEEDKEGVLTGNAGEQESLSNSNTDVVRDENIPVVIIDTTLQQEEQ